MPGSLFPRSPSLEPEHARPQHVRFASKHLESPLVPHNPKKKRLSSAEEQMASRTSTPSVSPPRQRNPNATVRAAIDRFNEDEADPSMLLPSPQTSPHIVGTRHYTNLDKGKARAIAPLVFGDLDGSTIRHVRGKEKELDAARADLDRNERRLELDTEDETFLMEQIKQDRDRDKARIRSLEEEIKRLKQEVRNPYPKLCLF